MFTDWPIGTVLRSHAGYTYVRTAAGWQRAGDIRTYNIEGFGPFTVLSFPHRYQNKLAHGVVTLRDGTRWNVHGIRYHHGVIDTVDLNLYNHPNRTVTVESITDWSGG